ncbi:MAG: hypothetical protein JWO22_501 [Frankiales bacterium]|nr:hypothetical protein [Frankiales bacterium]
MTSRLAFLRAVNLGKRRVSMPRVKEVLRESGHEDAWTYINSGNIGLTSSAARSTLESELEALLEKEFGFEVTTFVRTVAEVEKALLLEPFRLATGDTYFVTFLKKAPSTSQAKALESLSGDFDTLQVHGSDVHWLMRGRSSDSPLTRRDWEKVLGPLSSTSRNTTMLRKLVAKAAGT